MEDPGNNVTTVSLNKPINLFFLKIVLTFWHELSTHNFTYLVHLIVIMFFLNQLYLVFVAEKYRAIII